KLLRIRNRKETQVVGRLQRRHRPNRFSGDEHRSGDLSALDLLEGLALRHTDFFDRNAQTLEDIAHCIACSAASRIKIDLATAQVDNRIDIGAREYVYLLDK